MNLICDVCEEHVFFDPSTCMYSHARLTGCTGIDGIVLGIPAHRQHRNIHQYPVGKEDQMTVTAQHFADDPFAPVSAQLALDGSTSCVQHTDQPSPIGVRPWGLRRAARPAGPGRVLPAWRYDEREQLAVEIGSGLPLIVAGDPSADTTSSTDGEDGPSSEDWDND